MTAPIRASINNSVEISVFDFVVDSVRASLKASFKASIWDSVGFNIKIPARNYVADYVQDRVEPSIFDSVWDSIVKSIVNPVMIPVRDSVCNSVMDPAIVFDSDGNYVDTSVCDHVKASVRSSVYGQHDANWLAFYDFFRNVCGMRNKLRKLDGIIEVACSANWWLPHKEICWVSERHNVLNLNSAGLLHCESGPALSYPDGFCVWAINGFVLNKQIVMVPESQTIEQLEIENNADIRSIRINRFGWARYLKETQSECIDDRECQITNTLEGLYVTPNGDKQLVVECKTKRMFSLSVPNEIKTCENAQHWLAGNRKFNLIGAT